MTLKTIGTDGKKIPGWFSWRHKTAEAHLTAVETYQDTHGRAARQRRAGERQATLEKRVLQVAYEQNITLPEARRVAIASARFERRKVALLAAVGSTPEGQTP